MQYEIATEVEKVARKIIKSDYDELMSKNIVYVFQTKKDDKTGQSVAQMRKGKPILADIKIVGGLSAFLASGEDETDINGPTAFPCVVVSKYAWNLLKSEQRCALIDSLLCRIDYDAESGRPTLIDFDVKANTLNVKRYGAWNDDLALFLKTAKQHPLFEDLDDMPIAAAPVAEKAAEPTGKQQAKILKGNGADKGNGHAKDEAAASKPRANGVADLKAEVARRRSGRAPAATK